MSLPGREFEALIHPHTGDLTEVRPTSQGNNSAATVLVDGEAGPFFVKAVPNRPGGRRDSLVREGLVNPFVVPISPALRWRAEDDAWIVLGFEVIDGRSTDFQPGSADLTAVSDTLDRIAALPLPGVARSWREDRWDRFAADDTDAAHFRGQTLLHTDINHTNVLIGDRRTWAIDWAWPTYGAAFIDPALMVVQLIAAGHTAEAAEEWATGCAGWTNAAPKAVDAFAAATLRMYRHFAGRKPEESWLRAMADAAREWARRRRVA